jgi:hypothetical protein
MRDFSGDAGQDAIHWMQRLNESNMLNTYSQEHFVLSSIFIILGSAWAERLKLKKQPKRDASATSSAQL